MEFEVKVKGFKCEKCEHKWVPRVYKKQNKYPNICPKCKSKNWRIKSKLCSVCGKNKVYGKLGICRKCNKSYTRFYNLIKLQAKYQESQYPLLYKKRLGNGGKDIKYLEGKWARRHRKEIIKIVGNKCFICNKEPKKLNLHHLKYLNLNRKDLYEYSKFIIPLCTKHHVKLHFLVEDLLNIRKL